MIQLDNPFSLISFSMKDGVYTVGYEMDVGECNQYNSTVFDSNYLSISEEDEETIQAVMARMAYHHGFIDNPWIPKMVIARYYKKQYGKDVFADNKAVLNVDSVEGNFPIKFDEYEANVLIGYMVNSLTLKGFQSGLEINSRRYIGGQKVTEKSPVINIKRHPDNKMLQYDYYPAIVHDLCILEDIFRRWVERGLTQKQQQLQLFNNGEYESAITMGEGKSDGGNGSVIITTTGPNGEEKDITEALKNMPL